MPAAVNLSFGEMLRRLRKQQRLSQEELSKQSGVSVRQISSLEAGRLSRRPWRDTIQRLADALGLAGLVRLEFETAARGTPAVTGSGLAGAVGATRVLPRDTPDFIGRDAELSLVVAAARVRRPRGTVAVYAIDGMPGVGKTALAIHAAHRLAPLFPDKPVLLRLAGHESGRARVRSTDALAALLLATGMAAEQIPASQEKRTELWRSWLERQQLMLLLDDAADSAQVKPLLPGNGTSLVIVTSRRHLTALEDASTVTLDVLPPDQAADLLTRHADRPGLTPGDTGIAEISGLCGNLPLAVGIMGRFLHHHSATSPVELANDLSHRRDRLELMATEDISVQIAFDLSYQQLGAAQQRIFRRLSLHPGNEFDARAAALDGIDPGQARRRLEELYDQHLLIEPAHGRYRLFDLIREYAGGLARSQDPEQDREQAIGRLMDYYQRTAEAADRQLTAFTRPSRDSGRPVATIEMPDAGAALSWARVERPSLLACIADAVSRDEHARVAAITAAMASLFRIDGPWADAADRHRAAVEAARQAGDQLREADAAHDLGIVLRMGGDYQASAEKLAIALDLYRRHDDNLGEANALASLSTVHRLSRNYPASVEAAASALDIYRRLGDLRGQVSTLTNLGIVHYFAGRTDDSMPVLQEALDLARQQADRRTEAEALTHLGVMHRLTGNFKASADALAAALGILGEAAASRLEEANALIHLAMTQQSMRNWTGTIRALEKALAIYHDLGDRLGQGNALTFLGPALYETGAAGEAFVRLSEAEQILRDLHDTMGQANAWYYLGRLHRKSGDYAESEHALDRALGLYGSELPGGTVVVRNELGTLRLDQGRLDQAEAEYREALKLARTIPSNGDEAEALAGLGRCALAAGRLDEARDKFGQAREIFLSSNLREAAAEMGAELDRLQDGDTSPG